MDVELEVRPLTRRIGAEVLGVDLSRCLSEPVLGRVKDALIRHQVIFFRDQTLTHDQHKDFGRLFGELAIHPGVAGLPDHPDIVAIHADEHSTSVAGENWHSDLSCNAEPPLGSILYMHTVPEASGDTLFASMYAAYDALSPGMKVYLQDKQAVHDGDHVYRPLFPDLDRRYPCSTHPIVRIHPVSGRKGLYVNASYTTRIVGVPATESEGVLAFLYRHCADPNFQVRFKWRPGSVAFWDNRCTQHFAVWDYFPETRSGFRVTVAGDAPY